ncbi:uncharacterized protein AMSG_12370 [Thecamonas trahens ATCC 50062]|uniref:Tyrosine-protein kinase ephrin type A/B receptor-like domain-containing protein n=1 Tax=Thecamonas trahens ATCC 50062 TaxID=461836 RepID=A0A0L0DRR2_THETB|nr:hypothetical protein AMSG_12370 [Thecamonas trahens ATCC 50062]KNC55019.1 hypothetical protein AMSG_12370 [Thecamonas trahens ATCC 50062]|eukprot:XP_013753377.1 hypothetical protein AMSG_12370 [Thecamonas trahens ATCC 50062]
MTCVAASVTRWVGQCNGDTVLLPAGRYTGCWRDVPYTVAKSVRLLGEGPGAVLDCTAGERSDDDGALLFRVEGSTTVLKMENMIVLGARTNKAVFGGGSIEVVGGRLELVSVTVTNSTAVTANQLSVASPVIGFGGAVLLRDGGSLVARDSAFVSNTAEHSGGAIAAVGRDVSVVFERVRCVNNHALVSGGCLFLESADGTSFLEIVESVVEDNEAVGRSAAIAYPRRGGGGAVIALAGSFNVSVQRSTISRNVALENGGGLFLRASGEGRISAEFGTLGGGNESVVSDNTALGGSGGGLHAVSLENGETRIVLGSEAIVTANSASGSGGGIAAEAERASLVSSNAADVHGGGVAGSGRGADGQLTGSTLAENRARRIGGAVSAIGGGRMVVDGCVVRDNEAAFGGVGGATSGVDYLAGTATKNGQAIEASSASLEALLIEDEVTLGEGSLYSCAERGGVFVRSSVLMRNSAVHGSVGFGCGSRVSVEGTGSGFEFDVSAKPNGNDVGSGLFFSCLPEGGLCGMAGDPCCLAESPAELRGLPWASASSGMLGAFNQSLDKVQSVVGYGAMAAMPVVSLQWMAGLPELVSSGAPFGSGYGVVTGRDALGQVVVDPQLMLSMEFEDGAKEAEFAFVGSGRQQLMTDAELSFGGVGIAARSGAEVGVPIAVQIAVAQSAIPLELVPDAIVRDSVVVQACLPGSGAIIRPGSTVLECTLCAEGTFSNATSLEPCKICPASTVLTGQGATECLACPENAQVIPGFVPEPGLGLNCSCIPGFWTATGQINVGCEACPEGAKCDGGQSLPVARPGFFPTEDPGVFLECPNAGACKGGFPFRCTEGYTGQLCGACDRGYYALSGSCYKCDNRTLPIFAVVFVLAVCFVGLLVWLNAKEELSYRFAAVMIGFNSLQISAMYGQFELPWSNFASQFFNVVSFFNLNFDLSSPECATVTDDVWLLKWWMTVSLPLLFVVPFAIVYCSVMVNKHHLAPRLGHVVLITGGALRDACRRAYLQLMVLLYLPLAAMAMSYLQCRRDKDGRWVLEAAPAKSCYGTWYWNYFGVAVVFCVVYCLGLPSLVFYLLTRVRSVADPVLFSLRYAFLVGRFSPANYRFEVWIMARKVSVVMAMTFFRAPMTKANVALFALVVSMCQLVRFLPYDTMFHNHLALVCLASCLCILWAGTFAEAELRNGVAAGAICINVLAIVVGNIIDLVLIYRRDKETEKLFEAEVEAGGFVAEEMSLGSTFDEAMMGGDGVAIGNVVMNPVSANTEPSSKPGGTRFAERAWNPAFNPAFDSLMYGSCAGGIELESLGTPPPLSKAPLTVASPSVSTVEATPNGSLDSRAFDSLAGGGGQLVSGMGAFEFVSPLVRVDDDSDSASVKALRTLPPEIDMDALMSQGMLGGVMPSLGGSVMGSVDGVAGGVAGSGAGGAAGSSSSSYVSTVESSSSSSSSGPGTSSSSSSSS